MTLINTANVEEVEFKTSRDFSVGVELELQLIDPVSRELVQKASTILDRLNGYKNIKHELLESVIEINSNPCKNISDLKKDLKHHIQKLHKVASELDIKLAMSGTHPISNWAKQTLCPVPRYEELIQRIQMPLRRMLIYGMHIHVGLNNGQEAIVVNNTLSEYIPHLLALSCSSPYWVRRDSGMESYRSKIFETLPTTGLPFMFRNYSEFCEMVSALKKAKTIQSIREIWWDVRPHPDYGTVEVRICDAMPLMDDVIAVTALVQCLVANIAKKYRNEEMLITLPSFMLRENKWRASRYGLSGEIIVSKDGTTSSFKYEIEKLVNELSDTAKEFKCESDLYKVIDILDRGSSSMRQRKVYQETQGNWNSVVDSIIGEFERSWGFV